MENGASLLKKLGIIFLCIGTLGVSGSLILCFIVPSLWLFSIIFGSVLAVFLIVGIICMIIYTTKKDQIYTADRSSSSANFRINLFSIGLGIAFYL